LTDIAYSIGEDPQLVGVFTQSEQDGRDKKLPTILLFNSGLLSHVGPFRQYVRLAREFSVQGFNTFRFDLSGIGDSGRHNDSRPISERHMGDIQSVMNFLQEKHNSEHFIVMGICTGADNAHKAMVNDKRVVGAVCIDGYHYPTLRYYYNCYAPKVLRLKSWLNFMKDCFKKLSNCASSKKKEDVPDFDYRWEVPCKSKTESEYKEFIKRNVDLLCIFTASWPYNYQNQLADSFRNIEFGENIQTVYFENADHVFPLTEDREKLTTTIVQWLNHRFKSNTVST